MQLAGDALALSILPALLDDDLTDEIVSLVLTASGPEHQGAALEGLVHVARVRPALEQKVTAIIRRSIARGDNQEATRACRAVSAWLRKAADIGALPPSLRSLVSAIVEGIAAGRVLGLQPKLWCAKRFLEANILSIDDKTRLVESLGFLLSDLTYGYPQPGTAGIIGLSVARAECVRLSAALKVRGYEGEAIEDWLRAAEVDPLPEVRAALSPYAMLLDEVP